MRPCAPRRAFMWALIAALLSAVSLCHATTYAVLFSGGVERYDNHPRYFYDTMSIYATLTNVYSYDPANISVLFSDGQDTYKDAYRFDEEWNMRPHDTPWDLTGDGQPNILPPAATGAALQDVFTDLAAVITPDDILLFWITDHGAWDSGRGESYILGWEYDERIYASDMAGWLNALNSGPQIVVAGPCNSGGLLPALSREGRVTMTAAAWDEIAWGFYGVPSSFETDYDAWLRPWDLAVQGAGDANADGYVSMWEAFVYARENNPYYLDGRQNPQWDDPSGIGDNIHLGGWISSDPIPEPATVALVLLGLAAIWFRKSVRGNHTIT